MNLKSFFPTQVSAHATRFLLATLLDGLGIGVFNVCYQFYLITFGFGGSEIGLISTVGALGATVLTLPFGVLADRYGRRRLLLVGFAMDAISLIFLVTASSFPLFAFSSLLNGIAASGRALLTPIYSDFFDRADMDKAFGLYGFVSIAGDSVGSMTGFLPQLLVSGYGYTQQSAYWTTLTVSVSLLLSAMAFYADSARGGKDVRSPTPRKQVLASRSVVVRFSLVMAVRAMAQRLFFSLFPYYVNKKFGIESAGLGTLFFTSMLLLAVVNMIAPKVSERLGTTRSIMASLSLSIPFYVMIPLAPNYLWLSLFYVLRMCVANVSSPLVGSLLMKLVKAEERATANSIATVVGMATGAACPAISGRLMETASVDQAAFAGIMVFSAYPALFYLLFRKATDEPEQP